MVDLEAELSMLGSDIYGRSALVAVDVLPGRERYTSRYQSREKMKVITT